MEFNIINTPRLLLREMNPQVYQYLFSTRSDEALMEFFGMKTMEELQQKKDNYQKGFSMFNKSFTYFQLLNKETNAFIGWCGFHTWYTQHSRSEIGYSISDEADRGKGYMKEALAPILDFGFKKLDLHRIEAFIGPNNTPSLNLVKALGFTQEGHLREHYFKDGKMEDSIVFSLLKHEYKT